MRLYSRIVVTVAAAAVLTSGFTASTAQAAPPGGKDSSHARAECGVRADRRLWCGNAGDAPTRYEPYHDSQFSGLLQTTFSWFDCWREGGLHGGGNTTWYHTTPDTGDPGYVPADWVWTHSSFDANPSAHGLRHC